MPGTPLIKHSWNTTVKDDAGSQIASAALVLLGDSEANNKITVPQGQTAEIDVGTITLTKIVSIVISANGVLKVNTNAVDATGGQTINLTGTVPFSWNNQEAAANPVTQNITKFFAINSGTKDVNLTIAILMKELV